MINIRHFKRLIELKVENLILNALKKQEADFDIKINSFIRHQESIVQAIQKELENIKSGHIERISFLDGQISDINVSIKLISKNLEINFIDSQADAPKLNPGALNYDAQIIQLKNLEPNAYPLWRECFELGKSEYQATELNNLSTSNHRVASGFGNFIEKYANGSLLDIGCGPQLLPSYLRKSVLKGGVNIYGVEPIASPHPFPCYRGFAEFLPWNSESFDVVVCATSLDHCLSLDKTLSEIYRILKIDGVFILWVGFVAGSVEYDPKDPMIKKIDEYHLFHFDRGWLDSILERHSFSLLDLVAFDEQSHFYALTKLANK